MSPKLADARKWAAKLQNSAKEATKAREGYPREVNITVGFLVITSKKWRIGRPSLKLAGLASGPYKVIEKIGHAY